MGPKLAPTLGAVSEQTPSRRIAATITTPHADGWLALTDAGSHLQVPHDALTRLRVLQPGQRVVVETIDDVVVRVWIGGISPPCGPGSLPA